MRFPALDGSPLLRSLRAFQVYGANTNVGKTIVSTLLCKALLRRESEKNQGVWYLKPVSTGAGVDADDRHVTKYAHGVNAKCLWQFKEPISPHLAAPQTPQHSDEALLSQLHKHIAGIKQSGTLVVETAGGVHSPTPSGTSQADFYRPLRLPIVLIADSALGGISSSISAFESLHIRGYDVERVVIFSNSTYRNDGYLGPYFERHGVPTTVLPSPPSQHESPAEDASAMSEYYESTAASLSPAIADLESRHASRIAELESMPARAAETIWYPFTQHAEISPATIQAIDSAHGDFFQVYSPAAKSAKSAEKQEEVLRQKFDGSASWWTQGLGHANPDLTLAAAYAAGRYGHVMFPGSIHAPALTLAEMLLKNLGNERLERVFYSDNGSTGVEVALKMALRASRLRYGWGANDDLGILGLKGAYHGDTIGAMDCADPGVYNEEVEWYSGRGHWFDFPKVAMKDGVWKVTMPEEMGGGETEFASLSEVFDVEGREAGSLGEMYAKYIRARLEQLVKFEGRKFGAVMIEPVVLGAGGMLFADPLFQRTLVNVVRSSADLFPAAASEPTGSPTWSGLPIIVDEVFTGLYRLGRITSSSFLGINADISIHAKLLTGGLLPLCVTLSSDSIFRDFLDESKTKALLHGHSYTAHAVGCNVAKTSVETMLAMDAGDAWRAAKKDWKRSGEETGAAWSTWRHSFITEVSRFSQVEGVFALGSVLAITLKDNTTGYTSTAAAGLLKKLKVEGVDARTLGNVLYVLASLTTKEEAVRGLEELLVRGLGEV